jgi:hypothetical protein
MGVLSRVTKTGRFFLKITKNRRNRTGPDLKTAEKILFTVSKFQKKIKISKIYVKKTRSNSKVTGEEIFVKPDHLGW